MLATACPHLFPWPRPAAHLFLFPWPRPAARPFLLHLRTRCLSLRASQQARLRPRRPQQARQPPRRPQQARLLLWTSQQARLPPWTLLSLCSRLSRPCLSLLSLRCLFPVFLPSSVTGVVLFRSVVSVSVPVPVVVPVPVSPLVSIPVSVSVSVPVPLSFAWSVILSCFPRPVSPVVPRSVSFFVVHPRPPSVFRPRPVRFCPLFWCLVLSLPRCLFLVRVLACLFLFQLPFMSLFLCLPFQRPWLPFLFLPLFRLLFPLLCPCFCFGAFFCFSAFGPRFCFCPCDCVSACSVSCVPCPGFFLCLALVFWFCFLFWHASGAACLGGGICHDWLLPHAMCFCFVFSMRALVLPLVYNHALIT
ncbi:hypothetical protein AOLI_G00072210 [Acnodon oligacanthus]